MDKMASSPLVTECYNLSTKYLLQNATSVGLSAATNTNHESRNKSYTALFSRDIGVSTIGMVTSGNEELIELSKRSLATLVDAQSRRGQLPFYYKPEENKIQWWTPGSIDSTLWWSIAFLIVYRMTGDEQYYSQYKKNVDAAFNWLTYQDTNNDYLLEQGEASDWADEMPRQGAVLYTNSLWYWLICLKESIEGGPELNLWKEKVYEAFNTLFWVHKGTSDRTQYIPDNSYTRDNRFASGLIEITNSKAVFLPYYFGYVTHKNFEMRCDVFGNILACLVGLADEEKASFITDFMLRSGVNKPYPIKVLYPPIYPGEMDFKEFMTKGRQNYPWQYHNGGIWPFVGGFWIAWLSRHNPDLAATELEKLAEANSLFNFEFNEYLHGQHGTPMGIPRQSWNMGMFLAAYHAVNDPSHLNKVFSHSQSVY